MSEICPDDSEDRIFFSFFQIFLCNRCLIHGVYLDLIPAPLHSCLTVSLTSLSILFVLPLVLSFPKHGTYPAAWLMYPVPLHWKTKWFPSNSRFQLWTALAYNSGGTSWNFASAVVEHYLAWAYAGLVYGLHMWVVSGNHHFLGIINHIRFFQSFPSLAVLFTGLPEPWKRDMI